ncbi:hypothetical protein GCM10022222_07310 [Amycolatopsis ultiminotia]|uniref:Uncharacterized protein n=1 Tax=Amycolatopsis ultiminotia TaxID=543629 RepID=A0ABP6V4U2_9PSEU
MKRSSVHPAPDKSIMDFPPDAPAYGGSVPATCRGPHFRAQFGRAVAVGWHRIAAASEPFGAAQYQVPGGWSGGNPAVTA